MFFENLVHIVCADIAARDAHRPKFIDWNHALGANLSQILLCRPGCIGRILCLLRISSSGKVKSMPDTQEDAIIVTRISVPAAAPPPDNASYFEVRASGLPTNNREKVCVLHIG
ncbi:hypothetical protein V8G57_14180 [Collimonas sp. H4R21]|uniref:Uncharacterized protein n=1 Tax=Collimonas rhizosphaerae TaxID=3126357 RepID=A0ABU9PWZ5_9BURK